MSKKYEAKPLSELAEVIKNRYFKDGLYAELLNLNASKRLDAVFDGLERFMKEIGKDLTISQLRNIYNQIVKVKGDTQALKLTRPNLAYQAARLEKNENGKKVMAFIDDLIKQVDNEEKHKAFNKTMEAIVSYHKFYGRTN